MNPDTSVLLDTSVFVGWESGRAMLPLPGDTSFKISVVTFAELKTGVLTAADSTTRIRRMGSVDIAAEMQCLPIDEFVADEWAALRVAVAEAGRRANVNDLWIAATAVRHGIPVATQDADFEVMDGVRGLRVIRL